MEPLSYLCAIILFMENYSHTHTVLLGKGPHTPSFTGHMKKTRGHFLNDVTLLLSHFSSATSRQPVQGNVCALDDWAVATIANTL